MKKVLLFFVCILLSLTVGAAVVGGEFGIDNNLSWSYNNDTKELIISGTGDLLEPNSFWVWGGAPWYAYREDITKVVINEGVTQIGDYSFYECVNLKTISIPSSMKWIREGAFCGCYNLETPIIIPEGQYQIGRDTFHDCYKLSSVTIPNSVVYIEIGAFSYCKSLASIHIPANVMSIEESAFKCCTGLTSITVDENNPYYDSRNGCNALIISSGPSANTIIAINKYNTIPSDGTFTAGAHLFAGRENLTTMILPDNLNRIGEGAFADCPNLTTVVSSASWFGHRCFQNSTNLHDFNLYYNESIVSFGDFVFNGVPTENLTLHVPASLMNSYLENIAPFFNSITVVPLADLTNPVLIDGIYYRLDPETKTAQVVTKPEGIYVGTLNIPATVSLEFMTYAVTSVAPKAFAGSNGITAINVAADNTYLDSRNGCNAIIDKTTNTLLAGCAISTIPSSVTAIGEGAFAGLTTLSILTIPNSITTIGADAFAGCTGLNSIECYAEQVPNIGAGAFTGVTATMQVLKTAKEAYQTALSAFTGLTIINFPEKIITPTITYSGGKLKFGCETEGVTFHYQLTSAAILQEDTGDEVELAPVYQVSVYATKEGWIDSDPASLTVNVLGNSGDVNGDGQVNITDAVIIVNLILSNN